METVDSPTLILFSGLAADANVFVPQKLAFPQLVVPRWPVPRRNDTLESYCQRIAADLPSNGKLIIGGASFGGIVALQVAKNLSPAAVVLIGSVRSPSQLPWIAKLARPLKPFVQFIPVALLQLCCAPLASRTAKRFAPHLRGLAWQFCRSDREVFRWSLARILDWKDAPDLDCPVFHVHGSRDMVLPVRYTHPDETVAGGGHVISLTHPDAVNEFVRRVIQQVESEEA